MSSLGRHLEGLANLNMQVEDLKKQWNLAYLSQMLALSRSSMSHGLSLEGIVDLKNQVNHAYLIEPWASSRTSFGLHQADVEIMRNISEDYEYSGFRSDHNSEKLDNALVKILVRHNHIESLKDHQKSDEQTRSTM